MNEVVLVSGTETSLGGKLIETILEQGSHVIVPFVGNATDIPDSGTENLTLFPWNRSSWFSTKTVIRESLRLFHQINSAWILHSPIQNLPALDGCTSSDIDNVLEQNIKGFVALTREIIPALKESNGFLGMVHAGSAEQSADTLDAMAEGAFTGFAETFIREAASSIWACGMHTASTDFDSFIAAMLKLRDEKPVQLRGRWYRHTDKQRLIKSLAYSNSIR
ncbi:MAG: hypothetical protein B0D92_07635 [Spirochaeta sp. LUC14_002_19_P3]|nr:MAG: hypothetical protein B0D92_07635 [Spirochaeta sp. LUC14_002_19_P3]